MANVGHLEASLGLNMTRFTQGLNRANQIMKRTSAKMTSIGRSMTMSLSAPLAIIGGLAIKTFADFEAAMNQVKAVTQGTAKEMQALEGVARKLGKTTKFSATEAAEGMNFLAMAGFKVHEIIEAMPAVLSLAAAGKMELARAADHVSNIMRGFGIETSKTAEITDILTATFTRSNTSLEQIGDAMSYAAPVMRAFKQDITTTAAAIGFLSDAGIQASRAGTGLRQIFTQLVRKEKELGINMQDANGKFYDLADIISQLEGKGRSLGQIFKIMGASSSELAIPLKDLEGKYLTQGKLLDEIAKKGLTTAEVFGIMGPRAGIAMATLMDRGSESLRNFSKEVGNAGGITDKVAKTQMEGLTGAFVELKSALGELSISFTKTISGALESFVDWIKQGVLWMSSLSDRTKKITIAMIAFTAALGPAVFLIGTIGTALAALWGPVGIAIAAVAALAASFTYLYYNWEAVKERISDWSWWRNAVIDMALFFVKYNPWSLGYKAIVWVVKQIPKLWNTAIEWISNIDWWKVMVTDMLDFFIQHNPLPFLDSAFDKLKDKIGAVRDELKKGEKSAGDMVMAFLKNPFEPVEAGLESLKGATKEYEHQFKGFANTMKLAMSDVGDFIAGIMPSGGGGGGGGTAGGKAAGPQAMNLRSDPTADMVASLTKLSTVAPTAMVPLLAQMKSANKLAIDLTQTIQGGLYNAFVSLGDAIGNLMTGDISIKGFFQSILLSVADFLKNFGQALISAGVAALAFKALMLNPIAAVAAGIALVAASAVVVNLVSKGPQAQGMRSGGFVSEGGMFQLHKDEMVALPTGSSVMSQRHSRGAAMGGGGGGTLTAKISMRQLVIELDRERQRLGRS